MGKQINFYAIEQDYDVLLGLAEENDLLALPGNIAVSEYEAGISAVRPSDLYDKSTFLILKDIPVDNVVYLPTHDPSILWLDYRVSPVMAFSISYRQNEKVFHGRFFVSSLQTHRDIPDIVKAFQKLARYIRKNWTKESGYSCYVGPHTQSLYEQGHIRLMP